MELRQLQSFREVVREGSFTAAAKRLHMTQPAVSLHIKGLEKELGARLMERDTRGVRLTPAGEVMLETADVVLGAAHDCRRRIGEMEAPERGTVMIACGDTVALHLLPPVLTAFRAKRPQADVTVRNHGSRRILDLVLRREVDLGIVTRPAWLDPALQARDLEVEPFFIALPPDHPLASDEALTLDQLEGEPAVLLARPSETRGVLDRGLSEAEVEMNVVMESGNLEVVKAYVANGMGVSILPAMAVTGEDHHRMAIRPVPPDFPKRRLALVRRKDRRPSLLAADMLLMLAEQFHAEDA